MDVQRKVRAVERDIILEGKLQLRGRLNDAFKEEEALLIAQLEQKK